MAPRAMGVIDEVRAMFRRVEGKDATHDVALSGGRSDGALPELQHDDALGDLPRALRRLRLHPSVLRRRSLQLSRATRRRQPRGHNDEPEAGCLSCGEHARAGTHRSRGDGPCATYRADNLWRACEETEQWLRSVINTRHGGRGGSARERMTGENDAVPTTAREHERPAEVSGLLRVLT